DTNEIHTFSGATPEPIVDYIKALGTRTFHAWRGQLAWASDTRNDFFAPTSGTFQRISAEVALPGSTVEYYKINYEFSKYWQINRALVLNTRAEIGYGDSFSDPVTRDLCYTPGGFVDDDNDPETPPVFVPGPDPSEPCLVSSPDYRDTVTADGLPFFENFYAGGVRSVRGFRDNTLGPRYVFPGDDGRGQALGGALKTTGSVEMYFPTLLDSPAARISAFLDFGNVFEDLDAFDAGKLRASAGVTWQGRPPVGSISISNAFSLLMTDGDEFDRLQFTFGGASKPPGERAQWAAPANATMRSAIPRARWPNASGWRCAATPRS